MKKGIKHLIQCHCILPQFRKRAEPLFHKFVVFSILDEFDNIEPKIAQCNNCDILHKVFDVCKSELLIGRDETNSITSIDELKLQIPESFVRILEDNKCDLSTWENLKFILDHEQWGENLTLSRETLGESTHIKVLLIDALDSFKIESHLRKDEITGEYLLR